MLATFASVNKNSIIKIGAKMAHATAVANRRIMLKWLAFFAVPDDGEHYPSRSPQVSQNFPTNVDRGKFLIIHSPPMPQV
jgi:hypothetical protein